jgi:hypothetical protein
LLRSCLRWPRRASQRAMAARRNSDSKSPAPPWLVGRAGSSPFERDFRLLGRAAMTLSTADR